MFDFNLDKMRALIPHLRQGHADSMSKALSGLAFGGEALSDLGTLGTPSAGTLKCDVRGAFPFYRLDFTLAAARISVTDAGASGSYGTLKLWTFPEQALVIHACRQDYTAFAEGSALTGGAGDASFDIGVGSVAKAAAADGALTTTDDDIGDEVNITLSGGSGTGTGVNAPGLALNGTATASTLNLNWSGSAATIDANSEIDVTGTISVALAFLGDD